MEITSQSSARIRKRIAELRQLRYLMERCDATGLCAVCNVADRYQIAPDVFSMTCERMQCKRAWLLNEPYRCEVCHSLNFERLAMRWDEMGRKLYYCGGCDKTYTIHRRAVLTMADADRELQAGGEDD